MAYDSTDDTKEHIGLVCDLLDEVCADLIMRGRVHDASKFEEPEKSAFDIIRPRLETTPYSSEEYKATLREFKTELDHHFAHNRHHPEFEKATKEEWRPVVGFEGSYEVSNLGEVRSVDREIQRGGTRGNLTLIGSSLRTNVTPKGYLRLQLRRDKNPANRFVHVLVAEAFVPNPENKPQVNHKDGDKQNCRAWNLEWATASENLRHAYDNGFKDGRPKYVVECKELGLVALGCTKMEVELHKAGYDGADAAGIWRCINEEGAHHLGLTFEGHKIEQPRPYSGIAGMNVIDLVEFLCDCEAASRRRSGDALRLDVMIERFGIEPQLASILANTVRDMEW